MLPNLLSSDLITLLIAYTFFIFFLLYNVVSPFSAEMLRSEMRTLGKLNSIWKSFDLSSFACSSLFQSASDLLCLLQLPKNPAHKPPSNTHRAPCRLFNYQAVSHAILGKFLLKYKTLNPLYTFNNLQRFSRSASLANSHKQKILHCKTFRNQLVISIACKSDCSYKRSKPKGRSTDYLTPACCGFKGIQTVCAFHI